MISRRLVLLATVCATLTGCFSDSTAPAALGSVSLVIQSPSAGSTVVFEKVRAVLRRAGGTVALDNTFTFPSSASSITVVLTTPLTPGTPATGEQMSLSLDYLNAAGSAVFKAGPITVTLLPVGSGG